MSTEMVQGKINFHSQIRRLKKPKTTVTNSYTQNTENEERIILSSTTLLDNESHLQKSLKQIGKWVFLFVCLISIYRNININVSKYIFNFLLFYLGVLTSDSILLSLSSIIVRL